MSVNKYSYPLESESKLYKFQFDTEQNLWQVTERRWGSEVEQKMFNRFVSDENTYYQAAKSLKDATTKINSGTTQEMLASYRKLGAAQRTEDEGRDQIELRRERFEEIATALQGYAQPVGAVEEGRETVNYHESVVAELYHSNGFSFNNSIANYANAENQEYGHPAELAYALRLQEQTQYLQEGGQGSLTERLNTLEKGAERIVGDHLELDYQERRAAILEDMELEGHSYEVYGSQQLEELHGEYQVAKMLQRLHQPQQTQVHVHAIQGQAYVQETEIER
jgi:hypothetical protein